MSRGKSSFIARLASLSTVAVFLAFLAVGCDGGGDDDDGGNPSGPGGGGKIEYGTLTDSRDGQTYKTVTISTQTWMAENLNYYIPDSSWCYGLNDSLCTIYGRLYSWHGAMVACPSGWHLPTNEEWTTLVNYAGGSAAAGNKLKAKSPDWNGTDNYGFSALPGGYKSSGTVFRNRDQEGGWWTASEINSYTSSTADYREMSNYSSVGDKYNSKGMGYSARCLQD